MATLTLKNVPEELIEKLKVAALDNRRSLNQEALMRLERSLLLRPTSREEKAALIRASQARFADMEPLTDEFLNLAKTQGRP